MATFEASRDQFDQEHFEVFEIILPVITGACTLGGSDGYGTPLTCDQAYTDEIETYRFCTTNAPLMTDEDNTYYRVVKSISETPTELKPGEGLASRGSLNVTLIDFIGDPNPDAPGVTDQVKTQGTFFGKLNARQILSKKTAKLKLYRVESDGTIDFTSGAQERTYTADVLSNNGDGTWTINCSDPLSVANLDNKVWPKASGGSLRANINNSVVAIPVDQDTDYSAVSVVRVGDEFMEVNSVTDNQGPAAALNVSTRGSAIVGATTTLTETTASAHSSGDEVFICYVSDDERIDDLLEAILLNSDVPFLTIPSSDWFFEVNQWHTTTRINTIWYKSQKVNKVLTSILQDFLLDMWYSPESGKIKLSAISVWKQSASQISDSREILPNTLRVKSAEAQRATRALAVYNKPFLSKSDDVENYTKAALYKDDSLTAPWIYGEHKDKLFEFSTALDSNSADLLVQRYVERFKFQPEQFTFKTDERLIGYDLGDVVDIVSEERQAADGSAAASKRAQILSIRPVYGRAGRTYQVKALSYEPAFEADSEIIITGTNFDINLFFQYAGAPGIAVDLTFVFDGATVGSTSTNTPGVTVGPFPSGSSITIIMVNGSDLQARGGNGGRGQSLSWNGSIWSSAGDALSGKKGGTCIDCSGTDCEIYFSGATGNANYPTADGYIRAPGGGGAGVQSPDENTNNPNGRAGNGGGGGAGIDPGNGGDAGTSTGAPGAQGADRGDLGDTIGNGGAGGSAGSGGNGGDGGDWGQTGGTTPGKSGGTSGAGVIDGGGTVNLYGTTAARYINGNGDHP